jgi:hypothetical protein
LKLKYAGSSHNTYEYYDRYLVRLFKNLTPEIQAATEKADCALTRHIQIYHPKMTNKRDFQNEPFCAIQLD